MVTTKEMRAATEEANRIRIPRDCRQYFHGQSDTAYIWAFWDSRELPVKVSKHGSRRAYTIGKKKGRIVKYFIPDDMYVEPDLIGIVKRELEAIEKV